MDKKIQGIITGMNCRETSESELYEMELKEVCPKTGEVDFSTLLSKMLNGFAYCEMVWGKNGEPEDFVYLEVNDAFERLTGLKKETVLGKRATEVMPGVKETYPELFEIYGKVASSGKEESFEIFFEPLDIWLSISVYSLNKNYFATILENVTERKKRIEKVHFQADLLNAVRQTIIATDNNRIITHWNRAAEKLHGWSETEMIGQHVSRIIPEDIAQELMAKVDPSLEAKESWSGEITTKRRHGAVIPIMITISPILNSKGELVGTISVETDISEQKWLQQVTNEAVAKVTELNEKLQVVESLTRHDIRNKMSALNGRIYLLKKRLVDNPEASANVKELELLSTQIFRILEFERIYVQVGAEELEYVNVANSFEEAATLFSTMNGVELVNDCVGFEVLADSLLRQLFYNLMDNSFKYGEKLRKIRVRCEAQEKQLNLVYEDDGVGITEATKSNLFKQGFGKGTGYGLYLIKKICKAYGWAIEETGKQGEGVRFVMTIPRLTKDCKESYKIS